MKKKQRPARIRIVLVDDHVRVREALRNVISLEPDLEVVGEADGGHTALRLLRRINPDVVLMDGSMPDMNGIETTRRVKQVLPKAKIVGLTLYGESTYLEEMVAAGASAYVIKSGTPENLIKAIRIVNDGGTYFDPAVSRRHATAANPSPGTTEELTAGELAVVKLIANGQTNDEIAGSLGLELKTVEARRKAAMKKLGLSSRAELVRVAAERNWLAA
jgi:two-component system, NarL family, response regulator NreC